MQNQPLVSVLMPVYNCENYILEAVESILQQTYFNFELLIIDDCSTDGTVDIIKSLNDDRIQLHVKLKNSGYTNSLNYGLQIANGKYIARMDGDDISLPKRFEKQVTYLEANDDVVVCGSALEIINKNTVINFKEFNQDIKGKLLCGNHIAHPSVMMRKEVFVKNGLTYDIDKEPAEDFDLWVRMLKFGKLYNFKEVLLKYRVHEKQVSYERQKQQNSTAIKIRIELLNYLDGHINLNDTQLLEKAYNELNFLEFNDIQEFIKLKEKLINLNKNEFFNKEDLESYLLNTQNRLLKDYFTKSQKYSPIVYINFLKIKRESSFRLSTKNELKILVKSLLYYSKKV